MPHALISVVLGRKVGEPIRNEGVVTEGDSSEYHTRRVGDAGFGIRRVG